MYCIHKRSTCMKLLILFNRFIAISSIQFLRKQNFNKNLKIKDFFLIQNCKLKELKIFIIYRQIIMQKVLIAS